MSFVKKLLVICYIISATLTLSAQTVFIPFTNNSEFEGSWNLSVNIPDYLAGQLSKFSDSAVISASACLLYQDINQSDYLNVTEIEHYKNIARLTGKRFVASGNILAFNINRYMIGEPSTLGYEYYTAVIECRIKVVDTYNSAVITDEQFTISETRSELGINILGKPSDSKAQFYSLDKIPFGSEDFNKTLAGVAMIALSNSFLNKLLGNAVFRGKMTETVSAFKNSDPNGIVASIIYGDNLTGECYLAIGRELVQIGDVFRSVSTGQNEVIEVVILEIKGDNLVFATASLGKQFIKAGIKLEKVIKKG